MAAVNRSHNRAFNYRLVLTALLVALSVVLTRFVSFLLPDGTTRIGIGPAPITIAGLLLGPVWGGAAGLASDLLGYLINSFGQPFHPGISLASVLEGVIPGLVSLAFWQRTRRLGKPISVWEHLVPRILISLLVVTFFSSGLLTTVWIAQLLGLAYPATLIIRTPGVLINGAVRFFVVLLLMPALKAAIGERLDRQLSPAS